MALHLGNSEKLKVNVNGKAYVLIMPDSTLLKYTTKPNDSGTTIVTGSMTTKPNDSGLTLVIT